VVYVGGLLVIFSYFLAICPNQAVNVSLVMLLTLFRICLGFTFMIRLVFLPSGGGVLGSASVFYFRVDGALLSFLGLTLFLGLVRVVKVVEMSQGPLRVFC